MGSYADNKILTGFHLFSPDSHTISLLWGNSKCHPFWLPPLYMRENGPFCPFGIVFPYSWVWLRQPNGPFRTKNAIVQKTVVFCYRHNILLSIRFRCYVSKEKVSKSLSRWSSTWNRVLEGDATKQNSVKNSAFFTEWGPGIQWMKALVRNSTGQAIHWKGSGVQWIAGL